MSFGSLDWQSWVLDEDKALPLLRAAYDKGLNTWDTGMLLCAILLAFSDVV
jgi:aryl-alcohol dehydrogenase-like predicted oxidoreductase